VNDFTIRLSFEGGKLLDLHGPADITKETTEAIVNAANASLLGGGGVDGAIHRAGGPAILNECKKIVAEIGHLPDGQAVLTTGGRLPAKYVIHTVGPIYGTGNDAKTLDSCYRESIRIADDHGIRSLTFPSISTGAFGYPVHEAAQVAVKAAIEGLTLASQLAHVRFVLFDNVTLNAYAEAVEKLQQARVIAPLKIERGSP
jgi:O-acetyl-ADP-ribose deacetylase (regulator of RNase III)